MKYKNNITILFLSFFLMILLLSSCRSVDGDTKKRKEETNIISVTTENKETYHIYAIEETPEQTLEDILTALKKEKKDGKTEPVSKIFSTWIYDNKKTKESITAFIRGKKEQIYSFSYQVSKKENILATRNQAIMYAWDLVSKKDCIEHTKSLEFLPLETAVQKTQSFLDTLGFHNVSLYRYSVINSDSLKQEGQKKVGKKDGYYYMVFTLQTDGISHFTTAENDYYRSDLVNKSATAPSIECFYDSDGIFCITTQTGFFTIQSDLGTVSTLSYEKALEKANVSMYYMQESLILQESAHYQWESAGIEYLPYRNLEKDVFQLIPVWVFRGKKESDNTIEDAYILIHAETGEVLSESR